MTDWKIVRGWCIMGGLILAAFLVAKWLWP